MGRPGFESHSELTLFPISNLTSDRQGLLGITWNIDFKNPRPGREVTSKTTKTLNGQTSYRVLTVDKVAKLFGTRYLIFYCTSEKQQLSNFKFNERVIIFRLVSILTCFKEAKCYIYMFFKKEVRNGTGIHSNC